MRKACLSILFISSFHYSVSAATFGVRLDNDFYFQQRDEKTIELNVENSSDKLIFASVDLYPGKENKSTGEVEFDFSSKVTNYDVLPTFIAVPVGQSRRIKLVRDALDGASSEPEEYYRIRVTPKSAEMALKNNPKLLDLLTPSEKREAEDSKGVSGNLNIFIGSGSILVVQRERPTDAQVSVAMSKVHDGIALTLTNNSKYSYWLKNSRMRSGDHFFNLGDFVVRGGKSKTYLIDRAALKKSSINEDEVDMVVFNTSDKKEQMIKVSR